MSDRDPIRFACPHCGKGLRVAAKFAGKRVRCPKCNSLSAIPTVSARFDVELQPPQPSQPSAARLLWPWMVGSGVALALLLGLAIWFIAALNKETNSQSSPEIAVAPTRPSKSRVSEPRISLDAKPELKPEPKHESKSESKSQPNGATPPNTQPTKGDTLPGFQVGQTVTWYGQYHHTEIVGDEPGPRVVFYVEGGRPGHPAEGTPVTVKFKDAEQAESFGVGSSCRFTGKFAGFDHIVLGVRTRRRVPLVKDAIVELAPQDRPAASPTDASSRTWKNDWETFVAELSPYFKRGAPISDLKEKFEGQEVTWVGEIEEVSIKPDSASVQMKMPAKPVALSNGSTTDVDNLHLTPEGENVKKWQGLKAGTPVRFRTTLKGGSLFPVVALLQGAGSNAGKARVVISTKDAEMVEVMKSASVHGGGGRISIKEYDAAIYAVDDGQTSAAVFARDKPTQLNRGGKYRLECSFKTQFITLMRHVAKINQKELTPEARREIEETLAKEPLEITSIRFDGGEGITGKFSASDENAKSKTMAAALFLDIDVAPDCKPGKRQLRIHFPVKDPKGKDGLHVEIGIEVK